MPELPEVETVRRNLEEYLGGHSIETVEVRTDSVIRKPAKDSEKFIAVLQGRIIETIDRRGKYLIFALQENCWLVVHLGMTGKVLVNKKEGDIDKHTHVVFNLDDGNQCHYHDVRKFGGLFLYTTDPYKEAPISKLGLEPFDNGFTAEYLYQVAKGRHIAIKSLLLDQHVVAGLGNIYADEVLFAAGVRPRKASHRLNRSEADRLVVYSRRILDEAIAAGGSTIRDYRDASGKAGQFQLAHKVYGRAGQACYVCGSRLEKVTVGGRTSVYCPKCQRS